MKRVDVLYFTGCPNHRPAVELVQSVASALGIATVVREIEVHSREEAARLRFLGSPTILVDGVDVEPEARTRLDFEMSCRTYGGSGLPSRALVRAALSDRRRVADAP